MKTVDETVQAWLDILLTVKYDDRMTPGEVSFTRALFRFAVGRQFSAFMDGEAAIAVIC